MDDLFNLTVNRTHLINRVKEDPFARLKKRGGGNFAKALEEQQAANEQEQSKASSVDHFDVLPYSSPLDNCVATAYYKARLANNKR